MSKTVLSFLIFLVSSIPFYATALIAKKDVLKQLNFTEGQYEVVVPEGDKAAEFCEDEILQIEMPEDKENVSLLIGAKLIFPQINKSTTSFESNLNCKTTQKTKIENKKLTITRVEKCADRKKTSNAQVFQINFKNDVAELSIKDGGKTTFCQYRKNQPNSKEK